MGSNNIGEDRYDFKGVFIPKEIWLSREMKAMEKMIFIEIWALDRDFGCIAKNDHFVDMFNLSERQVREHIKNLKDKGLVEVVINKRDDTRVMKVVGKYARVSQQDIQQLGFMKRELVDKFTSSTREG